MFDVYEAVDDIIDEINENYNESCYEDIYDELCERVECGLLSVADAELINEAAYDKYILEARNGHSKKVKQRIKNRQRNTIDRFKREVDWKDEYDSNGNKISTISNPNNGERIEVVTSKKFKGPAYFPIGHKIIMHPKHMKYKDASAVIGGHEGSHADEGLQPSEKDREQLKPIEDAIVQNGYSPSVFQDALINNNLNTFKTYKPLMMSNAKMMFNKKFKYGSAAKKAIKEVNNSGKYDDIKDNATSNYIADNHDNMKNEIHADGNAIKNFMPNNPERYAKAVNRFTRPLNQREEDGVRHIINELKKDLHKEKDPARRESIISVNEIL